jgi:ubiquinol-cytochrome c reductase cytochrome b subunit
LPWDQRGWWARIVEGNIVGLAPVVGGWIEQMICGGPELGALGLTRAYAAHVLLLPLLITVVLALRLRLRRREMTPSDSLWIEQAGRGVLVAIVLLCALFGLTRWAHGAPLDAPADPLSDYPARPEWFLMSLYELRKFFHGSWEFWGTTLIPGAAGAYLALLPWIDRPGRSRAAVLMPVVLIFGGAIGLGAAAYAHDRKDAHYAKARQKADLFAGAAAELAMKGVPPGGPLEMLHRDPELRGRDLFEKHCANCHVMEGLGDPEKATASKLDGWGTRKWIEAMVHDPDAPEFFGRGAYQGQMPSVDQRPTDPNKAEGWVAMVKSPAERQALALFLEAQGAEPNDDPPHAPYDRAALALGEKIVSERCTTCHLYKGEGDDGGTEISPELAHYGSLAWTTTQVQDPSSPKNYRLKALDSRFKGHMPRFERELSPADVDIVSRWTRAHARGLKLH